MSSKILALLQSGNQVAAIRTGTDMKCRKCIAAGTLLIQDGKLIFEEDGVQMLEEFESLSDYMEDTKDNRRSLSEKIKALNTGKK